MPSPAKGIELAKLEPKTITRIFAGYHLECGYIWRGDYLIWALDDFLDVDVHRNAVIKKEQLQKPHRVRNMVQHFNNVEFLLKDAYERRNNTLDGIQSSVFPNEFQTNNHDKIRKLVD